MSRFEEEGEKNEREERRKEKGKKRFVSSRLYIIYRYRSTSNPLEIYYNWLVNKFFWLYVARSCLEAWLVVRPARSLARSLTCLSLEVLSLINPYRNGVTALVSLVASHFLPPFPPATVPFLPIMVILPEPVTPRSSS